MKTLHQWLDDYGVSHRNPRNKLTHWIGIPMIVFAVFCGLKVIPVGHDLINVTTVTAALMTLYYLMLSVPLALGMMVVFAVMYAGVVALSALLGANLLWFAVATFVVGWLLQFWGHKIEGVKPSFFEDLQYLMIGPLWLLSDVYRRLDWPLERAGRTGSV